MAKKYRTMNGWNVAGMLAAIESRNAGVPSMSESGDSCVYFSQTKDSMPNRCGVGCFLPDDAEGTIRRERLNDESLGTLLAILPELAGKFPIERAGLEELQMVHDHGGAQADQDPRPRLAAWITENVEDGDAFATGARV